MKILNNIKKPDDKNKEIKMKDFIRNEDGSIMDCYNNTIKMTLWERIVFDVKEQKFFKRAFLYIVKQFEEGFIALFYAMINTMFLLLFPITLIIKANNEIKIAKEEMGVE